VGVGGSVRIGAAPDATPEALPTALAPVAGVVGL
jgi:hypothetical protein